MLVKRMFLGMEYMVKSSGRLDNGSGDAFIDSLRCIPMILGLGDQFCRCRRQAEGVEFRSAVDTMSVCFLGTPLLEGGRVFLPLIQLTPSRISIKCIAFENDPAYAFALCRFIGCYSVIER